MQSNPKCAAPKCEKEAKEAVTARRLSSKSRWASVMDLNHDGPSACMLDIQRRPIAGVFKLDDRHFSSLIRTTTSLLWLGPIDCIASRHWVPSADD
jgi:hypothetical protein